MSFADSLINRKKQLKPCETVVTSTTGNKFLESRNKAGEVECKEMLESCHGFVVDEKLDLEIAQILDFLCLSSQDVAQDYNLLESNGISHVLSIGVDLPNIHYSVGIEFKKVDLLDEPDSNLIKAFETCFDIINKWREEKENCKILVHCNAGYSRAPTIVIGYLMKTYGYSLKESFDLVKQKRDIKPNVGFMKQLEKLEEELTLAEKKYTLN